MGAQYINQNSKDLVNQAEILGVIGHSASDVTIATAKAYDAGKLVAISPISSAISAIWSV